MCSSPQLKTRNTETLEETIGSTLQDMGEEGLSEEDSINQGFKANN